jgi:hypothetical protein
LLHPDGWEVNRQRLAQAGVITLVCFVVIVGLVAEFRLRNAPPVSRTSVRPPAADVPARTAEVRPEAVPPIYGPPSPLPPIYGPPTPPSRVPLLDPSRRFNAPVLNVTAEVLRPKDHATAPEPARLTPWGWDQLDLDRGIPFLHAGRGDRTPQSQAEARRTLFEQASGEAHGVSVLYCIDPSIGQADARMLDAVRTQIKKAVQTLRPGDRFALLMCDSGGSELMAPWQAITEALPVEAWTPLDRVQPGAPSPMLPCLSRALSVAGASHVVAVVAAAGANLPDETARLVALIRTSGPRVVTLVVGDGTATPRAEAMRRLAVATRGAFAWLKPLSAHGAAAGG